MVNIPPSLDGIDADGDIDLSVIATGPAGV